jgi:hypothetical protein
MFEKIMVHYRLSVVDDQQSLMNRLKLVAVLELFHGGKQTTTKD